MFVSFSDGGGRGRGGGKPPVNSGLQLPARNSLPQAGAFFPSCSPAGLSTAQRQGMAAWTADRGLLDPWIPRGHAAQPLGGPAVPPLHVNVPPRAASPWASLATRTVAWARPCPTAFY